MNHNSYHIHTFGCQANLADSERISADYESRGFQPAADITQADHVIINTCMVRKMAEDRVCGLYQNLINQKLRTGKPKKIIVTGCMVGAALRDPTNKYFDKIRQQMPQVDEWLPIEEIGFDHAPLRTDEHHAWIPISNGCNNFCTFCIVPFTRGREISRPFEDILHECQHLAQTGYTSIALIGQNVNSYGADLILGKENVQVLRDVQGMKKFFSDNHKASPQHMSGGRLEKPNVGAGLPRPYGTEHRTSSGFTVIPTYVKHLGRYRIPTLFPQLLSAICEQFPQFTNTEFISSNPWDFSDDLITTIAKYPQISRQLHLPVQSGSTRILKKMNRWYTQTEYLTLIDKIKQQIPDIRFTTDIIVGFPDETDQDFEETIKLVKAVKFTKAYVSRYSPRPHTAANHAFPDNINHKIKKARWEMLNKLINT